MIRIQRLQYTQLLEVHRTYFTIFLQVLAVYLAVMGGCITIVATHLGKIKIGNTEGSKTVLLILIIFALITSVIFLKSVLHTDCDAHERTLQIAKVAEELSIIPPVKVVLLEKLLEVVIKGTVAIIILWLFVFLRCLIACIWPGKTQVSPSNGSHTHGPPL